MTDNLRDRIAAVTYNAYAGYDTAWDQSEGDILRKDWLEVADTIIAELRLERETWNPDMGVSVLPRHMWVKPTPVYRYVTDWVQTND